MATTIPTPDSAMIAAFKSARRVSTPIIAIETPDAAATILQIRRALTASTPILSWDCARGLTGLNEPGKIAFAGLGLDPAVSVNATETLIACEKLPELAVVCLLNAHRQLADIPVVQALWNLRDQFKANQRTVILLGPSFQLPAELADDVIVLDEPLPTRAELSAIIDQQHKNANMALPDDATRAAVLDALVGLPSYTAEQVSAMALEKKGISVPKCWTRKIQAIENHDGLTVWKPQPGDTTIDELRGLDNVVAFLKKRVQHANIIVFIDEMDKALAGGMSEHTGDSGVSKDQVKQILTYIEDNKHQGVMLAGCAGTGKTQLAKALGAYSNKPVVMFDLGGMKGGVVGDSEKLIRGCLKVITATAEGQGKVLFIGTANKTTLFTPEINRRFPDQFFFDVLSDEGRAALWPVYASKNGLSKAQATIPAGFDAGWSGAEIARACARAAQDHETVVEAAQYIIPSSVAAKSVIAGLRREAHGRFLAASHPGLYRGVEAAEVASASPRSIEVQ